jgi:DNA modification methylase
VDAAAWRRRAWIIWGKDRFVFSRATQHYRQQHEPCLYASLGKGMAKWYGPTNESTMWTFDKPQAHEDHPTSKPTALYMRQLTNSTPHGGLIADGFCGSGSLVIAAEQLTRACRALEIEPQYVQVALDRWAAFTGQTPQKVGEAVRSASPKSVTPASVTHGRHKKPAAAAHTAAAHAAQAQAPQPAPARRRREKARPR